MECNIFNSWCTGASFIHHSGFASFCHEIKPWLHYASLHKGTDPATKRRTFLITVDLWRISSPLSLIHSSLHSAPGAAPSTPLQSFHSPHVPSPSETSASSLFPVLIHVLQLYIVYCLIHPSVSHLAHFAMRLRPSLVPGIHIQTLCSSMEKKMTSLAYLIPHLILWGLFLYQSRVFLLFISFLHLLHPSFFAAISITFFHSLTYQSNLSPFVCYPPFKHIQPICKGLVHLVALYSYAVYHLPTFFDMLSQGCLY